MTGRFMARCIAEPLSRKDIKKNSRADKKKIDGSERNDMFLILLDFGN